MTALGSGGLTAKRVDHDDIVRACARMYVRAYALIMSVAGASTRVRTGNGHQHKAISQVAPQYYEAHTYVRTYVLTYVRTYVVRLF